MEDRLFCKLHAKPLKSMCLRLFIICIALIKCVITVDNSTLVFVIVLYRHGDRSPISAYPNDPYQEDHWAQGFGQLTQIGMLQEYNLGQFLMERYIDTGFLSATYDRKQLYVRSTDRDRTIMSAQSVLAGLYPLSPQQQWKAGINWQPIPVHNVPQQLDTTFYNFPCRRLDEADREHESSKMMLDLEEKYKDKMAKLSNYTGFNMSAIDGREIHLTFDALLCEDRHGLALPLWATKELRDEIRTLLSWLNYYSYNTILQRRLRGGLFLQEYIRLIKNYLNSKHQADVESPKFIMFSAHDSTILKLLGTLGMYNNQSISYSTNVMVEFHHSNPDSEEYYLQFWFRNDTQKAPYQLQMPGCALNCPFQDFLTLTKPLIPDDLDAECVTSSIYVLGLDLTKLWAVELLAVSIGLAALILIIALAVCCWNRKWRHRPVRRYARLRAETIPEEVPMINKLGNGSDLDD